ncbi:hypothetical protein SAMN05428949_6538 [Chitinophaga sp. YR627]|uniref:hypothetical protein n=1 Tax=Chitinophaga sp. YR627 TaxID=1881041 RepID=UPI0008E9B99F|nr:hypothetical protein [Chitinophaga sp. YR627]SFO76324.1 hypothetical protein SAMN05428949_6538 [Chitinophaga sp. YR627]
MKRSCLILTILLYLCLSTLAQTKDTLPAQNPYAKLYYSRSDIEQLKRTADSLNLKYLECVPNPLYHSLPQTEGTVVTLSGVKKEDKPKLEDLLKKGATLQEIRAAELSIIEDSAHVLIAYENSYDQRRKQMVTTIYSGDAKRITNQELSDLFSPSDTWMYVSHFWNDKYSFVAWRRDHSFSSIQLPVEYAKMIQYVDCMVDPCISITLYDQREEGATNESLKKLVTYMMLKNPRPADLGDDPNLTLSDYNYLYNDLKTNARTRELFDGAIKEAIEKRIGNETLELLADGRYSPDTLLLLKRIRQVVGFCSMDNAPSLHTRDIAKLAAQTHQWPVFIRSHLDIMNDRFQRNSDASYGKVIRGTHFPELELLDIPVQQLLLGTVFWASDLAEGHYWGNIGRLGRAFTESAHAADFEKQVLKCMQDDSLDPINRCLFFMLYTSYCFELKDTAASSEKIAALKADAAAYPEYISRTIHKLH